MDIKSLLGIRDDAHVTDPIYDEELLDRYLNLFMDIHTDDPSETSIKECDDVVFPKEIHGPDPSETRIKEDDVVFVGHRFHSDEEIVEFYPRRNVVTSSTSVEIIKQADIYKYDPWDLSKNDSVQDDDWYFYCKRGRKYRNCLRPGRVTGSGFWKASDIDNPMHSSSFKTGSVNNRWEMYTSIFNFLDNHRQQRYALPRNVGPEYRNGYGYNSSGGETSTRRHHSYVPEVHIDILNENNQINFARGNNDHTDFAIYRAWNDYRNQLKSSKFNDDSVKMVSGTLIAVGGQVIAGLMVNRLTSSASSSSSSWVEVVTVLGLCITLLGISLCAKSRPLSTQMIKIGAVTTACAIIFSMGLYLPPMMAWTVGPVAFLIMAIAAAFA